MQPINEPNIYFREITQKHELELFFQLRYESYFESSMHHFLTINHLKIDLDVYDLHSKHFGIFKDDEPIGYLRVVVDRSELYVEDVFEIGERYGYFNKKEHSKEALAKANYVDFPFMSYLKTPESVYQFYQSLNGKRIVEASRLLLIGNNQGLDLARFLTECALVIFLVLNENRHYAVLNCDLLHQRFYLKYGFETIPNSRRSYLKGIQKKESHLLTLTIPLNLSVVAPNYRARLVEMGKEYSRTRIITKKKRKQPQPMLAVGG